MICVSYFSAQKIETSEEQRFCIPVCYHVEYFGSHYVLTVVANKNSLSMACVLSILNFFNGKGKYVLVWEITTGAVASDLIP